MNGYTYDTGALIAAEAGGRKVWTLHRWVLAEELTPVVPAAVLAQAWRGGPQPLLSRLLHSCAVEPLGEGAARAAGAALARARSSDVVDASVVVSAAARSDTVVTSDPKDIRRIADALGLRLAVVTV